METAAPVNNFFFYETYGKTLKRVNSAFKILEDFEETVQAHGIQHLRHGRLRVKQLHMLTRKLIAVGIQGTERGAAGTVWVQALPRKDQGHGMQRHQPRAADIWCPAEVDQQV